MAMTEANHKRLVAYHERDVKTMTIAELADYENLLRERLTELEPKKTKREFPRFV